VKRATWARPIGRPAKGLPARRLGFPLGPAMAKVGRLA
jgi:hypothetical protein